MDTGDFRLLDRAVADQLRNHRVLSWVHDWHFSRAAFAQPVVTPEYRALIPPHETAMPGVVLSTMSQVYPQDRGQSYAVAMARRVVGQHFRRARLPP